MAFRHGKDAAVYVNAVDVSSLLTRAEVGVELEMADATTFQASWRTANPGLAAGTANLAGYYDDGDTTLQDAFDAVAESVVTVCPSGATAVGDLARLLGAPVVSMATSSPVGGLVAVTAGLRAVDAVGHGYLLHPLGADVDTTTGSAKDDTAATSTGWCAHLHVTAVTAGSWVVTVQDSADGSSGWATIATFTAATGATQQRLEGAAGATVRRYVRYVATRTGGTGGDSITFALAFARATSR